MTELYIDGVSVVLPTEFSTSVKRENPFITKNGEYTYDITLELTNAINSNLYLHLNRLNSVNEVTKLKRKAVLVANNRVLCNGTEVITGWTESEVSLQILSGNSELNYFIGSNLLISALKMPITSPYINGKPDLSHVKGLYPDVEFALFPVNDRTNKRLLNDWGLDTSNNLTGKANAQEFDYIPQPFLCAYIKAVLKGLGYDLIQNDIEKTTWKDLCIVHANKTHDWAKMLPGWDVKGLLEEVERLYNASFVINQVKRTAKLLFNNGYYMNSQVIHVQNIIDQYEVEQEDLIDVENDALHSNLSFDLPSNEYWRWRRLSKYALKRAATEIIPKTDIPSLFFDNYKNKRKDVLFKWEADGRYYIYLDHYNVGMGMAPYYRIVNEFNDLVRNEDESKEIKLSLIPSELDDKDIFSKEIDGATDMCKCPIVDCTEVAQSTTEETGSLSDIVMSEEPTVSESRGKIFLVFHKGLNNVLPIDEHNASNIYPIPFVDEYIDIKPFGPIMTNNDGATLRLSAFENLCYNNIYDIDLTRAIKITSYDKNLYDLRAIFEIRNKRYVCKEVEYTVDTNGMNTAWKGTFHPIRIADTEADSRWLLTDGKWRDGGVWIDNGRWLDE